MISGMFKNKSNGNNYSYEIARMRVEAEWRKDPDYWKESTTIKSGNQVQVYNKFNVLIYTRFVSETQMLSWEDLVKEILEPPKLTEINYKNLQKPEYTGDLDSDLIRMDIYLKAHIDYDTRLYLDGIKK